MLGSIAYQQKYLYEYLLGTCCMGANFCGKKFSHISCAFAFTDGKILIIRGGLFSGLNLI